MKVPHRLSTLAGLPYRQVHLDFHNSADIRAVGSAFRRRQFQEALRVGKVESITLFAKCHHGWSYHRTKVGRRHPGLAFDLLDRQIDACRAIGVRCPIYLSAGFDERLATAHPDWVVRNKDGSSGPPFGRAGYRILRFNSPYLAVLCEQIAEVVARWPDNDGIFLDIVGPRRDYADASLREMVDLGLDPEADDDVDAFAQRVLMEYHRRTTAAALSVREDTPVFHNSGHLAIGARRFHRFNSHYELESLPTGGWGYDHFPYFARYASGMNLPFLGMTGKFHTTWGEFGGFKRPAALQYECSAMLALGARCSVGDQLHPSGAMNPDTYELIGRAYGDVAEKQRWCEGYRPVARIAIVSAERAQAQARGPATASMADEGAARMLDEMHLPFAVLDHRMSWRPFELVILSDDLEPDEAMRRKLRAFLKRGGKVIAAGRSLLDPAGRAFLVPLPAEVGGRSPFDPDYLVADRGASDVPVRSAVVIHGGAYVLSKVRATVLARRRVPRFNRGWRHFSSHQHAPDERDDGVAAFATESVAYFGHNIFTRYRLYGQPLYRDFVASAVKRLLGSGLPVQTNLPTSGRLTLTWSPSRRSYVVHVLFTVVCSRGGASPDAAGSRAIEMIEDAIPLSEIDVSLHLPRSIREVRLLPSESRLEFQREGQRLAFRIPRFTGHQMIELRA